MGPSKGRGRKQVASPRARGTLILYLSYKHLQHAPRVRAEQKAGQAG